MNRTAAVNQGSANRRFVLLAIVLGLIGAVLVYVAFSRESTSSGPGGQGAGPNDTPVVVAKTAIPARTRITQAMIEVRLVPRDTVSDLAFGDPALVLGEVTRFPIAENEQVLSTKVVTLQQGANAVSRSLSYVVPPGKRGFAINFSDVQGAGGLVLPGDYVDVVVIYDVKFADESEDKFLVVTMLQNVEVLAVSQAVVDVVPEATPAEGGQRVRNSEAKADPGAGTVTLALTPEELQRVYLAEGNGTIRLAVRPFGEDGERPVDFATEIDLFPPNLPRPPSR